jgi:hypothetical protein
MLGDKKVLTGSIQRLAKGMTQAERLARIEELRRKARDYLPMYEKEQHPAKGQPTINLTVTDIAAPAN